MTDEQQPERRKFVFRNESDHWIAYDVDDAYVLLAAHCGITRAEAEGNDDHFELCPDDESLTIRDVDFGWPDGKMMQTMREWADTEPRGMLCSTEY